MKAYKYSSVEESHEEMKREYVRRLRLILKTELKKIKWKQLDIGNTSSKI
jgi:hypothetical protein